MKKILSLTLCAVAAIGANANIGVASADLNHAVIYPGLVEIDINGDGILDLIYSGDVRDSNTQGRVIDGNRIGRNTYQAVWNTSTNSYDISEFPFYFGTRAQFAVWDFNGDGLTDFVVTSETSMVENSQIGMYLNNGDGTFRQQAMTIYDKEGEVMSRWEPRNVDVADFNSDGLMDIVCIGWHSDASNTRRNYNQILLNQGDGTFKATATDLICAGGNPYEFALSTVVATDLNNDGYADFLCMGNVDNTNSKDLPIKNGVSLGRSFNAFLNLGAEAESTDDPVLYDLGLAESVSHLYGHGSIHVCDFNNDGVMDIVVGGESPSDARGAGDWAYFWQYLTGSVASDGVSFADATTGQAFANKDIRPLNDVCGTRAIDYNGNGQYDLFIPGWCTTMLDGTGNTQAGYYFANTDGAFSTYEHIPGASELAVFFMENGVSGARNYGFVGQSWDGMFFSDATYNGRMMVTTTNPYTKAARPDAPTGLTATVNASNVTLAWTPAESSQANVTYDYYIRNAATGVYYTGVTAFVGGDKDGIRTTLAQGRAFMNKTLNLIGLPDGTYEWGVQTVNAGLEGSTFAKGSQFTIGGLTGVNAAVEDAVVVATDYYDVLGRKLTAAPANGIAIQKQTLSNGAVKATKVAF